MDSDPYSLANLRDIAIPDAPPLWPLATGACLVLAIAATVILWLAWHVIAKYRQNAYRRSGLVLLCNAATAHEVSVIMKRVALAAFPREQVASLHGEDWQEFLHKTCSQIGVQDVHSPAGNDQPDAKLIKFADTWIRLHRVVAAQPVSDAA